jgi:anti-anti-sigma factor
MSTASDEPLAPGLRIDRNVNNRRVAGLIVTGEIDMAVADQFRSALLTALQLPGVIEVVVDFGPLRFLDCSGVGILVEAKREADRRCTGLRVVNVEGLPRRVLETLNEYDTLAHGGPRTRCDRCGGDRAATSPGAGDPVSPPRGAECRS